MWLQLQFCASALTCKPKHPSYNCLDATAVSCVGKDLCTQVGPYDHTVRKPTKGSVLAYWHAEEGLKANDAMSETVSTDQQLPVMTSSQRRHPPRRVDVSGGHPKGFEASLASSGQADESSVAPQVSTVKCTAEQCAITEIGLYLLSTLPYHLESGSRAVRCPVLSCVKCMAVCTTVSALTA